MRHFNVHLPPRYCEVCELRIPGHRPKKALTCDPTCQRAKENGRTRERQIRFELKTMPWGPMHEDPVIDQHDKATDRGNHRA